MLWAASPTVVRKGKSISEVGPIDPKQWADFASNLYYHAGDYANPEASAQLAKRLAQLEAPKKLAGNRLFYLSTPPEVYPAIVRHPRRPGLSLPSLPAPWSHTITEK